MDPLRSYKARAQRERDIEGIGEEVVEGGRAPQGGQRGVQTCMVA